MCDTNLHPPAYLFHFLESSGWQLRYVAIILNYLAETLSTATEQWQNRLMRREKIFIIRSKLFRPKTGADLQVMERTVLKSIHYPGSEGQNEIKRVPFPCRPKSDEWNEYGDRQESKQELHRFFVLYYFNNVFIDCTP